MPTFAATKGGIASSTTGGIMPYDDEPEYLYSTMIFQQAFAPVGWIRKVDPNIHDTILRITSGSVLTDPMMGNPFTNNFAPTGNITTTFTMSIGLGTISATTAMLPSHIHTVPNATTQPQPKTWPMNLSTNPGATSSWSVLTSYTLYDGTKLATTGPQTTSVTGIQPTDVGHKHNAGLSNGGLITFGTGDINWSLKYVDAIVATRI